MNAIEQALSRATDRISVDYDGMLELLISRVRLLQSEILTYYGQYATEENTDFNKHRLNRETRDAINRLQSEIINLWREILERLNNRFSVILVEEVNSVIPAGVTVDEDEKAILLFPKGDEWIRIAAMGFLAALRSGFIRGGDFGTVTKKIRSEIEKLQTSVVRATTHSISLTQVEKKKAVTENIDAALSDYAEGESGLIISKSNGIVVTIDPTVLDASIPNSADFKRAIRNSRRRASQGDDGAVNMPYELPKRYRRTQGNSMSGVCRICAPYIGMITDGTGTDGVPLAPLHVNCVCHDTPIIFDNLTGDEKVNKYDWVKSLTERELSRVIGKTRALLVKTGKLKISELYDSSGKLKKLG